MARFPKLDYQGFEKEVSNAHSYIYTYGRAICFYMVNKGFVFRHRIAERDQVKIDAGEMTMIGTYTKPLRAPNLIEEMKHELESRGLWNGC